MKFHILALCLFTLSNVACSNQWREGDAEVSSDEMLTMLSEVSSSQVTSTGSGGDLSTALALKDTAGVRVYFAQSKGIDSPLGPVASILSFVNFEFLNRGGETWKTLAEARVFFLDVPSADGHQTGLIVGTRKADETALTYVGFSGTGSINGEEYIANLQSNGQNKLVLRSFDLEGNDLASVIQMLVYETDSSGVEYYNGKFSTLVGFGD